MGPFYYDLLDQDLKGLYGDVKVEKHSKAGATSSQLGGQITTIPKNLDGPVLVTITIGGNDVQQAMPAIITGGTDDKARADFATYLDDAFKALTAPDAFGAGVQVKVLIANVYDPSDGTGNFKFASGTKCPGALGYWPAGKQTGPLLDKWEQVMTDEAAKFPGVTVVDLRAKFQGHGVPAAETWFYSDCIHPNTPGHSSLRDLFLDATKKL
jgi:lysophospholipase L1-like esterase